jgi:predicted metal-dependent hydrolase
MSLVDMISQFIDQNSGSHEVSISYSGKFSPYNARVIKRGKSLQFNLSRDWENVSDMIVLGLLESLTTKILKIKNHKSTNIDLYHNFVKSLHLATPKTRNDDYLKASFERVNSKFFEGLLDLPNFAWHSSIRRLATYDHHTDTLSVSQVFKGRDDLIDFLVYHELLHKKLKFSGSGLRTTHHGKKFRELEEQYPGHDELEKQLVTVIRSYKRRFW